MQQKPYRGAPRKAPAEQFTEHTAVMLRPCDRDRLERLADGEPMSAYIRRILRQHVAQQLNLPQGG